MFCYLFIISTDKKNWRQTIYQFTFPLMPINFLVVALLKNLTINIPLVDPLTPIIVAHNCGQVQTSVI